MRYLLPTLVMFNSAVLCAQNIEIKLKHGGNIEAEGKDQLERIFSAYNDKINRWFFTKNIVIDKNVVPFSHPVLTLNCKYLDNDFKQLATFLHEQFHWYVASLPAEEKNAINEFKRIFPVIPVGGREGARDEYSSYLHLIVCDLEFQAMTKIIGDDSARKLLSEWTHYTWIYKAVLENKQIREINMRSGFIVP